jgi:predicted alpha/beta superfamily hydrolase
VTPQSARPCDDRALPRAPVTFDLWSPQLRNRRDIDVYLPASYDSGRKYPVVYMQDGQNLSDPMKAFAGTWELDRVLRDLARRGVEAIVVGVHNAGDERLDEYSPEPDRRHGGGGGDAYLAFLADTVKPRIDRRFRTRRRAAHTVIAGSSMGGLISAYAWFRRPDVFGHAAALSPALWFGRDRHFERLERAPVPRGRLYLDVGTAEGVQALRDARLLRSLLARKGLRPGARFRYREDRGGRHEEAAWKERLAGALEFLLDG